MTAAEQEVREAVDRYYRALNRLLSAGDTGPMLEAWSRAPGVTVMHPEGDRCIGWEQVRGLMESWAKLVTSARIGHSDLHFHLLGDVAIVTGWERGQGILAGEVVPVEARATLVFRREAGAWKVVHHHDDMVPGIRDEVRHMMMRAAGGEPPRSTEAGGGPA